ncbi:hypothetical protein [Streptomyces sp. MK37H]|uniref:hypothetical protein n=1 Tax=Streptomyces sp. MK37H TaxID=2699117 RepID=UPI001B36AC67|nr:hypothetical protein [Streptomyces sp. MK37H]MBP8538578.1 hypothetical protein [Streptomyces sp. MK37H]
MTDASPADEIRAAAENLRALATAASTATATPIERGGTPTTRWYFKEREKGHGYLYAANPDGPGTRLIHSTAGRGSYPSMRARHGEYAAAMDPTVGLALADLLDVIARTAHHEGAAVDEAFAVARQILGETRA